MDLRRQSISHSAWMSAVKTRRREKLQRLLAGALLRCEIIHSGQDRRQ